MKAVNTVFDPMTCAGVFGTFDPLPMFRRFANEHPELTARAAYIGGDLRWPLPAAKMSAPIDAAVKYAQTAVKYERDLAGQDTMELPRVTIYRSPLTGQYIKRKKGDCEDIAAGQKHVMRQEGAHGELLRFLLTRDRATGQGHMMLCVLLGPALSILLDNRRQEHAISECYDIIGMELHDSPRWAWCREPTAEDRARLGVDEEGNRSSLRLSSLEQALRAARQAQG